jgi:hypothetical protein
MGVVMIQEYVQNTWGVENGSKSLMWKAHSALLMLIARRTCDLKGRFGGNEAQYSSRPRPRHTKAMTPAAFIQVKPNCAIWPRPETRTSFSGFLNTPNRFYALVIDHTFQ